MKWKRLQKRRAKMIRIAVRFLQEMKAMDKLEKRARKLSRKKRLTA